MTLGQRLKMYRQEIGISQEAMGSQGFVSVPGWIKIENGQRFPSDRFIMRFVGWLIREKYTDTSTAGRISDELLTLKYLGNRSHFVRKLARIYAEELFGDRVSAICEEASAYRLKRTRNR